MPKSKLTKTGLGCVEQGGNCFVINVWVLSNGMKLISFFAIGAMGNFSAPTRREKCDAEGKFLFSYIRQKRQNNTESKGSSKNHQGWCKKASSRVITIKWNQMARSATCTEPKRRQRLNTKNATRKWTAKFSRLLFYNILKVVTVTRMRDCEFFSPQQWRSVAQIGVIGSGTSAAFAGAFSERLWPEQAKMEIRDQNS